MNTQAVEIVETEVLLPEVWSLNCARLRGRLQQLLSASDALFDVLPGLECALSTGNLIPDLAIIPPQRYDWQQDVVHYPHPPLTVIEVLSPTQAFYLVTVKIREFYLAAGVKSAWLVVPLTQQTLLFLPDQPVQTFSNKDTIYDPASGVKLDLSAVFQ